MRSILVTLVTRVGLAAVAVALGTGCGSIEVKGPGADSTGTDAGVDTSVVGQSCQDSSDCATGKSCRVGECDPDSKTCQVTTKANTCYIDGTCYLDGQQEAGNLCRFCDPSLSSDTLLNVVCEGGAVCIAEMGCQATPDVVVDTGTDVSPTDTGPTPDTTTVDTSSEVAGDTGIDTGVDTADDTGTDTGVDTADDTGADTGVDTADDTGADTSVDTAGDTGADTGADTATDAGVDTGPPVGCVNDGDCVSSGNQCATATCVANECVTVIHTGASCDDDLKCTDPDTCNSAGVCSGTAVECDDKEDCTSDSCDPDSGKCEYTLSSETCTDGDSCTVDVCTLSGCSSTPMNCGDSDPCTNDSCSGGTCLNTAMNCTDSNPCTDDSCSGGKCLYSPLTCNDSDPCTDDFCQDPGGCTSSPTDCDDSDASTFDFCDPSAGCKHLSGHWIALGNGVVADTWTGLQWTENDQGSATAAASSSKCTSASVGGHDDWRLPTVSELRTLVIGCSSIEAGGACGVSNTCVTQSCYVNSVCAPGICGYQNGPGPGGGYFDDVFLGNPWGTWSGTKCTDCTARTWTVNFVIGSVSHTDNNTGSVRVRCVRD